jgi:hypothetical protein
VNARPDVDAPNSRDYGRATLVRSFLTILLFLGIATHTLPLRLCAMTEFLSGSSCHSTQDADGMCDSELAQVDGHASAPDHSHHSTCLCEAPQAGVNRHLVPAAHFHLAMHSLSPLDVARGPVAVDIATPIDPPPDPPSASVNLPLLI